MGVLFAFLQVSSCSKVKMGARLAGSVAPPPSPKQERIETNGDGVKPGSPHAGLGGANVQLGRTRPRLNIFSGSPPKAFSVGLRSVPVCFGVIREFMQHPLGGYGVFGGGIGCTSRGECCSPSFPSGFPPPLGKSAVLLKCGICFSSFLIEFESRIEIIKRRTVLTEHRSRGEEGDSTRTAPVST